MPPPMITNVMPTEMTPMTEPCCRMVRMLDWVQNVSAVRLRSAIAERMVAVGLMLHPVKTKIVYCKDKGRRGSYEHESFTFLGYTFRARSALDKHGVVFASFLPAVSREALKAMGQRVRGWRVHLKVSSNLADLARWMNPIVRGWMQYYGRFYRTELYPLL